jgi:hypothetical protein
MKDFFPSLEVFEGFFGAAKPDGVRLRCRETINGEVFEQFVAEANLNKHFFLVWVRFILNREN